eukprot:tig00000169_g11877.t1
MVKRDRLAVARAHWHDPDALQRDECVELRVLGHVLAISELRETLRKALTTRIDEVPRRFELGYDDMKRFSPRLLQ